MRFVCVVVILLVWVFGPSQAVIGNFGQKETPDHGGRSPHEKFQEEHYAGGHNVEKDHEAIIGSKKEAKVFDGLKPSESKARLRLMAEKMDTNKDGLVSNEELKLWITDSMKKLDVEEAEERYEDMDEDNDSFVTWTEYLNDAFGDSEEIEHLDESDKQLMKEDRLYFDAADGNKDGKLSKEELAAFHVPENHPHMHESLVVNALKSKDRNNDGAIDFAEFIDDQGESYKKPGAEWYILEKQRFETDYDRNKDGVLDKEEMKRWLVPDLADIAAEETEHLLADTDDNKDGDLSYDEIVAHYDTWVGSEATNFGDHLEEMQHTEL